MLQNTKILLVGCGKMGSALLTGWIKAGIKASSIIVIDPSNKPDISVMHHASFETLVNFEPDCVVLATKPQSLFDVLPEYKNRFRHAFFLSIAAGKPIAFYEGLLGRHVPIVRTMPNLPALIGKGVTALVANRNISGEQHQLAEQLMQAVGETIWLTKEEDMDAVTGVSGSGPAYLFYFAECLIQAGVEAGLSPEVAHTLAVHTLRGASELALTSPESLEQLRVNVTSPGGTTEAALSVLMSTEGLQSLVSKAVSAAANRSRELSS